MMFCGVLKMFLNKLRKQALVSVISQSAAKDVKLTCGLLVFFLKNIVRLTRRTASNASLRDTLEARLARFPSRLTTLPYGAELPSFVCEHERRRPICTTVSLRMHLNGGAGFFCVRWLHLQTPTLEFHPYIPPPPPTHTQTRTAGNYFVHNLILPKRKWQIRSLFVQRTRAANVW